MCRHRAAIAVIGRNYFAGGPILFRSDADCLDAIVERAQTIAEEYNDFVRALSCQPSGPFQHRTLDGQQVPPHSLSIDVRSVERSAKSQSRDEVSGMVRMAKAKALLKLGRNDEGCRLALRACRRSRSGDDRAADNTAPWFRTRRQGGHGPAIKAW